MIHSIRETLSLSSIDFVNPLLRFFLFSCLPNPVRLSSSLSPSGLKYQQIVDNLQEQLSICLREKDHVDNLLQDALGECDRLAALTDKGLQPLVDNLELQCSRKIESYGRSIAALNTEVNRGKLQLSEKQNQVSEEVCIAQPTSAVFIECPSSCDND